MVAAAIGTPCAHLNLACDPVIWDTTLFRTTRIPRYGVALLQALQFQGAHLTLLQTLDETDWRHLLALCDALQLTLLLGYLCRPALPEWVRNRIDQNYSDNSQRFERLKRETLEIASLLTDRSIDFTLLKGFAHSPDLTPDPQLRAQGDIDLWCQPDQILNTKEALQDLNYRPIAISKSRHLDPMIREIDWEWHGDYFALDLPIPVDLHYKLWDDEMERISGPPENEMWNRRCLLVISENVLRVLDPVDAVAFAALHVMMHLLHGDIRLQRIWELSYALHTRTLDEQFWLRWRSMHPAATRQVQTVAFLLARHWFHCELPDLIEEEAQMLSPDVHLWIRHYGLSPIEALFAPNKDELWLNLCLLNSFADKARVISRRLLPVAAAKTRVVSERRDEKCKSEILLPRAAIFLKRTGHHIRMLNVCCAHGLRWWWLRQELGGEVFKFLLSSVLFDFGEFIFFLLYNLYLLDRGFREGFLGEIAAAVTAGTLVGVLPAAALTRRIGLRNAVILAIAGTGMATSSRAIASSPPALICSAFLNGLFMSFWAVSLPPAVAGLTSTRNRALAFSLITSIGIGVGAIAALIGGRLPALLMHAGLSSSPGSSKRAALLLGSGFACLAAIPAVRLKFPPINQPAAGKSTYPRSRFLSTFLAATFIWSLGTGGFNPLFNVYFSRHLRMPVESIGYIFSSAQIAQVCVILVAPAVVKRMGEVRSITSMQIATATMLLALGFVSNPLLAAFAYTGYMCFQYMSEPCLFNMLMTHVDASEQSGASALNFFVTSLAGIFAAVAAGRLFVSAGYGATLACCGAAIVTAAALFSTLSRR